jgi:exonuclease SbcC
MKICEIRLKNFHSLKGEHQINFEDGVLKDAGLFVITGPTGSGKSSILDVITLALYNQIPRIKGSISKNTIESEGVIITKNTDDCYAEVLFEIKGELYRSNWSIKRTRNRTLSERTVTLTHVSNNNQIISNSISEVPKLNEALIGLNYEQFVQSMILAQGQFSKLLLAKRDERNKLLEEITGTSIYRKIGVHVFHKYNEKKRAVADQELIMGETVLLTNEEIEVIEEEIKQKEPLLKSKNEVLEQLNTFKIAKETLLKANQELSIIEQEETQLKNDKLTFEEDQKRLDEHTKFSIFKEEYVSINHLQKEAYKLESSFEKSKNEKILLEENNIEVIQKGTILVQKELNHSSFTDALQTFQNEVKSLVEKENLCKNQLDTEKEGLTSNLNQLNQVGIKLSISAELKNEVQSILSEIKNKSEKNKVKDLSEISAIKNEINELKIPALQLIGDKKLFDEKGQGLDVLSQNISNEKLQVLNFQEKLQLILPQINLMEEKLREAKNKLEANNKVKSLEHLRLELQNDCPCPLCGALEHPFVENHQEILIDLLQEQVNDFIKQKESLSAEKIKLESSITNANNNIQKLISEEVIKNNEFKLLKDKISEYCPKLGWDSSETIEKWQESIDLWDQKLNDLVDLEKLLISKGNLENILVSIEKLKDLQLHFSETKALRIAKYPGSNYNQEVNALLESFNTIKTKIEQNKLVAIQLKKELVELKTSIDLKINNLIQKINAFGLTEIEQLTSKFLDENTVNTLRAKKALIDQKETILKTRRNEQEKIFQDAKAKDESDISLEEIVSKLTREMAEIEVLKQEIWTLRKKLEDDLTKREKAKENQSKLEQLMKDQKLWHKMNELIGDGTGKKFSNFVQDLSLKQLLSFGNKRLVGFSDRYLFEFEADAESLNVIDTFMGNTKRSVSSLSGGESFKLSLALAFALSDMAAKNVNIESLFIDEGFGTLDPESLDQAISILEHMQANSNKSIGIISHVGELKERIGTKIKLVPAGTGYSKIEVE